MSKLRIADTDIPFNADARLPVCLCLDTSHSMAGAPIDELNAGVRSFLEAVKRDPRARACAELAVVTFGGSVRTAAHCAPASDQRIAALTASGATPMGAGVECALDLLDERKHTYRADGMEYHQPWLVLMTDGLPTDATRDAAARASALVRQRKLIVIPVAIGKGVNEATLALFSPDIRPFYMREHGFEEFFVWLSRSISIESTTSPSAPVILDRDLTWAEAIRRD